MVLLILFICTFFLFFLGVVGIVLSFLAKGFYDDEVEVEKVNRMLSYISIPIFIVSLICIVLL